jgi:hypothetical protein
MVTLPKDLRDRLHQIVPARGRSRFITEAIDQRLVAEEQLAVLDETAGAWTDEHHPDLRTDAQIEQWIQDLRSSWVQPE